MIYKGLRYDHYYSELTYDTREQEIKAEMNNEHKIAKQEEEMARINKMSSEANAQKREKERLTGNLSNFSDDYGAYNPQSRDYPGWKDATPYERVERLKEVLAETRESHERYKRQTNNIVSTLEQRLRVLESYVLNHIHGESWEVLIPISRVTTNNLGQTYYDGSEVANPYNPLA